MLVTIEENALFSRYGTICFLEGGSDAFDPYNNINQTIKENYDRFGHPYIVIEQLWSLTPDEAIEAVKRVIISCDTVAINTTMVRREQTLELAAIAGKIIELSPDPRLSIMIEQGREMRRIAEELDLKYVGNLGVDERGLLGQ